jgi:hypothetical protein
MSRKSLLSEFARYYPSDKFNIDILRYAEPNRLGMIALLEITAHGGEARYVVAEELHYGDDDRYVEPNDIAFNDKPSAERHYNKLLDELLGTPNWSAQEEYDREHGTINGYDPNILEWNSLVGED